MQEENSVPHADITIRKAQQLVDDWIRTYGVRYFNELIPCDVLTVLPAAYRTLVRIHHLSKLRLR